MKTNQLTTFFILFLFLGVSCEKMSENEQQDTDFLQNEWKVKSIVNNNKRLVVPSVRTLREEAYVLKFINDSFFHLATNVNYAGGNYQIVSDKNIVISNYQTYTEVCCETDFDIQLLSVFEGVMSYFSTGNKLIFRGDNNNEVVFQRVKK